MSHMSNLDIIRQVKLCAYEPHEQEGEIPMIDGSYNPDTDEIFINPGDYLELCRKMDNVSSQNEGFGETRLIKSGDQYRVIVYGVVNDPGNIRVGDNDMMVWGPAPYRESWINIYNPQLED